MRKTRMRLMRRRRRRTIAGRRKLMLTRRARGMRRVRLHRLLLRRRPRLRR